MQPVPRPTQVKRPWRATIRTVFQAGIAIAAMAPLVVEASGADQTTGAVAVGLGVAGAVTRIMALPSVEAFLQRFIPFLAADKKE